MKKKKLTIKGVVHKIIKNQAKGQVEIAAWIVNNSQAKNYFYRRSGLKKTV
jgi:hypothetical protein